MVDNLLEIDENKAKIRSKIVAISVVFEQVMKFFHYFSSSKMSSY